MLSITTILAVFVLMLISSATFFAAKRIKIPYTVLLVLVGLILVPVTKLPFLTTSFGFLQNIALTPELLFYVFLPVLIFESAFNMNMRKLIENAWHITLLAVVGLLISTVVVASGIYFLFGLIGLPIPFILALLFGAIISSTDPVAVLALFKEYHAPKRLTLIFEGESLFNDGTAVALFLVVLAVATEGFHGPRTVIDGLGVFAMMVVLGIIFGIAMATLFSKAIRYTRLNEFVSITLLLVSAHIVFILSELINHHAIFGLHINISPIIATTVASLFLGTYARHILSPKSDEYLQKSVEHLAFIANSLVFLLAGLLFASTSIDIATLGLPILITILVVVIARIISVYAITLPLNRLRPVSAIPSSWQLMLAWGSLRGALAIIIVLLIPDNFMLPNWGYDFTPRELLLALTIGCILATLLIKATTIGMLVVKLKLDQPTALQSATTADLSLYYLLTEKNRVTNLADRGYVQSDQAVNLIETLSAQIDEAHERREAIVKLHSPELFIRSLQYMALSIEISYLKELYSNDEVNETVYRKIYGKLTLQQEKIEYAEHESINPSSYMDRRDVFERLIYFSQNAFSRTRQNPVEEQYQYYRAQAIISRKAVKVISHMHTQYGNELFLGESYKTLIKIYNKHQASNEAKLAQLQNGHAVKLAKHIQELSQKALKATGNKATRYFQQKGIADESIIEMIDHKFAKT